MILINCQKATSPVGRIREIAVNGNMGCRRLRTTTISYHNNVVPFLETSYHI